MEVAVEKSWPTTQIFRHRPIIIYTRLPAGGTYYPICTFPASRECLISISDAFSAFCLRVSFILPRCSLYPQQKRAYSALHPQAWTCIYRSMPKGSYWVQSPGFLKIVYWWVVMYGQQLLWPFDIACHPLGFQQPRVHAQSCQPWHFGHGLQRPRALHYAHGHVTTLFPPKN